MFKKTILSILLIAVLTTGLFAFGSKEQVVKNVPVYVQSIEKNKKDYIISGEDESGSVNEYTLEKNKNTKSFAFESVKEGSVLILDISDKGNVLNIQDKTIDYKNKSYSVQFPSQKKATIWQIEKPVELKDRFSYAYGYQFFLSNAQQGVTFNAKYLARGILDTVAERENLFAADDFMPILDSYMKGEKTMQSIDETMLPKSLDEVIALTKSENEFDIYSYALGYYFTVYFMVYNGIELDAQRFAEGAITALYDIEHAMTDEEITSSIEEYYNILIARQEEMLKELSAYNLKEAESFLEENKKNADVIITESGLQYVVKEKGSGARPTNESTVNVDYRLTDLTGEVIDENENISFPLSGVVPGFAEAVSLMRVGDKITCYVHPSLGYGEMGTQTIQPNTLLIFDITLNSIEK